MTDALISVVIPTRDRAGLVREAIDSVLEQSGADFELIVVDDGSTDGTELALAARRARLRYRYQEQRGVSAARNAGAGMAHGEWLAFLDSDDLWLPGKLAAQVAYHRAHPAVLVSQTEEVWVRDGRRVNPRAYHRKPAGDIFLPSLARCLVSPSAVMLRRDVFTAAGGFDESLPACEDYDLWLRLARRGPIGLVPRPLVVKRGGHADQLSRRFWGMDRFRVAALLKLLATEALDDEGRRAVSDVLVQKLAILAQGARRRQRLDEAERYCALAEHCVHV